MIGVVVGTRPELIKIFPLIKRFKEKKINFQMIHTGQHYSKNLNNIFLKKSENLKVHYNLNVGSSSHAKQTATIMERLEKIINKKKFNSIIVYGDIKIGQGRENSKNYLKENIDVSKEIVKKVKSFMGFDK